MISKQFFLSTHLPSHPGFKHTSLPLPPRNMKPTIQNFRQDIQHLLPVTSKDDLKPKIKNIHTAEVTKSISNLPPNKLLQRVPPEVNKAETNLPRYTRSLLSQLRSGYSRVLNSYLHRIDPETEDKCPDCGHTPHDTNHLFNCPDKPTVLQVTDLWTQPTLAKNFLNLDEGVT